MSGKPRLQHSKNDKKQPRTSADHGKSAVNPDEKISVKPSASAKPPEATKQTSKKRKIAAIVVAPVISGLAGAAPPIAINAAQEAIHAGTAQQPSNVEKPAQQPINVKQTLASGGEYYFGQEWQSGPSSPSSNQAAAEEMARNVVEIALRKAGWRNCDPAFKRRYIQWILAGNMTPPEAAQILAQRIFQANTKPLKNLIRLIRQDRPFVPVSHYVYVPHNIIHRPK